MKNIYKIFAGAMVVFSLASCDDFLDQTPISSVGSNNFYTNDEEVEAAIIACYNDLQAAVDVQYLLTEVRSDNSTTYNGEGESDALDRFTETSSSGSVLLYWQYYYQVILKANLVIAHLDAVTDADLKKELEGEARFMRGYSYFNLVKAFGKVPLVEKEVLYGETEYYGSNTESELYTFITTDLDYAANNLPESFTGNDLGRINAWGAKAILAKVYLTRSEYALAKTELDDVISNSPYALDSSFTDVFYDELGDEILFAIQFIDDDENESQTFSSEMTLTGEQTGPNILDASLISAFDKTDKRWTEGVKFSGDSSAYICAKFVTSSNSSKLAGNDYIIMRYADVLLMQAEAILAGGASTADATALNAINNVRNRAGLADLSVMTKTDLLLERRFEFAFENQRWFDLIRFGEAVNAIAATGITIEEGRLQYAIPEREISVSNGYLEQNEYYK